MIRPSYGRYRLGQISDCVFAIAMTLLVFNLKMPVGDEPLSSDAFERVLLEHLPHFGSWILSLVVLASFWFLHHGLIARRECRSEDFVAVNFVFIGAATPTLFSSIRPASPANRM